MFKVKQYSNSYDAQSKSTAILNTIVTLIKKFKIFKF